MTNFNFKSDKLEWLSEYIEGKSKMGVFCMIIESHFKGLAFLNSYKLFGFHH